jgi:hypothetical protein
MVLDLLNGTRSWKSKSPDPQSKFFGESREFRKSWRGILHAPRKEFGVGLMMGTSRRNWIRQKISF